MSTTLIFVELLSAGTLALIALGLAFLGVGVDVEQLKWIDAQSQIASVIIALAIAYPLGIVVDGIADRLFQNVGEQFKQKYKLKAHHSVFSLAADKERWNDFMGKYFEYNRVRTRMVRSFLLNSILMLVVGALVGAKLAWAASDLCLWLATWAGITAAAWWSLRELREAWFRMLAISWGTYPEPGDSQAPR